MDNKLAKSLYQAVMKAIGSSSSNKHAAQHIVKDILDPNHRAQVPADHVPATKESVLHKDVSVSEMHSQKQAQAEAKLGMQPGQQKQKGVQRLQKFLENRKNKLEKGKDLSSKANPGGKHGFAKPGEKGIHQPPSKGAQISRHPGQSVAGFHARMGAQGRHPKENARYMHAEKLNELRSMPKPNLPKSEEGMEKEEMKKARIDDKLSSRDKMKAREARAKSFTGVKGVHTESNEYATPRHKYMDAKFRSGNYDSDTFTPKSLITQIQREDSRAKIQELKRMPKPKLPKSEHMAKAIDRHNKYDPNIQGVHRQQPMQPTVKDKGQSAMGQNVRAGKQSWGDPKSQKHMAEKVLQESKKIKPKLPK